MPQRDLLPSQTRSNLKPGLPRFVKKFKWSGELMMNTAKDRTDRVCDISLTEPAEPRPGAARFSVFFSTEEPPRNLTIAKLLPQSTLNLLRPACLPPAQVAKLGYQDEKDAGALSALAKYMASRRLMTYTSLSLDGSFFAILLIFPSSVEEMCRQFRVQGIQRSGPFVAVLIPWAVTGEKARKNRTTRSSIDRGLSQLPSPSPPSVTFSDRHHSVRFAPAYHRALRFLDLPKSVHDYISGPDHPCDIWHIPSDGTPNVEGFETKALRSILRKCRAVVVDSKPTIPRVVFVHVGSVRTLHRLPSLVDRRRDYASIRFYTYGTHPSVPPERWGHREIFPLGL
ncbi:hypothetical protein OF83DRAFT_854405 [Amylostereum chailletii]|nr:hypothetical protein OF83DRAFT_854405 [Amylostereum chailletii]